MKDKEQTFHEGAPYSWPATEPYAACSPSTPITCIPATLAVFPVNGQAHWATHTDIICPNASAEANQTKSLPSNEIEWTHWYVVRWNTTEPSKRMTERMYLKNVMWRGQGRTGRIHVFEGQEQVTSSLC